MSVNGDKTRAMVLSVIKQAAPNEVTVAQLAEACKKHRDTMIDACEVLKKAGSITMRRVTTGQGRHFVMRSNAVKARKPNVVEKYVEKYAEGAVSFPAALQPTRVSSPLRVLIARDGESPLYDRRLRANNFEIRFDGTQTIITIREE